MWNILDNPIKYPGNYTIHPGKYTKHPGKYTNHPGNSMYILAKYKKYLGKYIKITWLTHWGAPTLQLVNVVEAASVKSYLYVECNTVSPSV